MKAFNNKCENHNITTLGQKIDFFVYLFNKDSSINPINPRIVDLKHNLYGNNPNSNFLKKTRKNFRNTGMSVFSIKSGPKKNGSMIRKNSFSFSNSKQVYFYEIKSAFKFSE